MTLLYGKAKENSEKESEEAVAPPEKKPEPTAHDTWISCVEGMRKKLSIEELLFDGSISHECKMYSGKLTVVFEGLDFNTVDEILNEVYKDSSGELTISLESKHGLLLAAEAIQSINGEVLKSSRHEKVKILRKMNHNVALKIVNKYNQFDAAVKMLMHDEEDETIGDKLKK